MCVYRLTSYCLVSLFFFTCVHTFVLTFRRVMMNILVCAEKVIVVWQYVS